MQKIVVASHYYRGHVEPGANQETGQSHQVMTTQSQFAAVVLL